MTNKDLELLRALHFAEYVIKEDNIVLLELAKKVIEAKIQELKGVVRE